MGKREKVEALGLMASTEYGVWQSEQRERERRRMSFFTKREKRRERESVGLYFVLYCIRGCSSQQVSHVRAVWNAQKNKSFWQKTELYKRRERGSVCTIVYIYYVLRIYFKMFIYYISIYFWLGFSVFLLVVAWKVSLHQL